MKCVNCVINVENIKKQSNSVLQVAQRSLPSVSFCTWGGCVLLLGLDPTSPAHHIEKSGAGYYHLVIRLQQPA